MTQARLYYEAHITVQGKDITSDWPEFQRTAEKNGCRVSRFDVDEVDHYDGAWFLSCRDKDLETIKNLITGALGWLKLHSYEVKRWKIEDTLLDSKYGDIL